MDAPAPDPATAIARAFSMQGRVVAITGAASGLGREAARIFAGAGADVVLADVDEAGLAATAELVRGVGRIALTLRTDVTRRDEVEAAADAAVEALGRLDAWINSAGITLWKTVVDATPPEADRVVAVNMMGTYWGCAAAARVMKAGGGGAIVNVSSVAGETPIATLSVYGMTKAGVNQLTRVAAVELGPERIRVNAVVPGWIDTPINASQYQDAAGGVDPGKRDAVFQAMAAMSPLNLTGEPVDIALALLYFASDASRFVTGQTLRVSGGV